MRTIALMNQKGGVGKTTTTVNLGAALAELGKNVCLIDLDPQAHLTINYGVTPTDETLTLYDVLVEQTPLLDAIIGIDKHISLLPGSIDSVAAETKLIGVAGREMLLKKKIEEAAADASGDWDYDFVLLDCPPSLGLLTLNGLALADEVLIPMQPHFLPLQGVAKLLETVQLVSRRMNPRLKVSGIALTLYDSQTRLSTEVVAELNGFIEAARGKNLPWSEARVFSSKIRRNIKLAESPSFGQHIMQYDPNSNGAIDYRALAREVVGLPALEAGNPSVVSAGGAAAPADRGEGIARAPTPTVAKRPRKVVGKVPGAKGVPPRAPIPPAAPNTATVKPPAPTAAPPATEGSDGAPAKDGADVAA